MWQLVAHHRQHDNGAPIIADGKGRELQSISFLLLPPVLNIREEFFLGSLNN